MPTSRSRRVLFCSALVLLIVAVGLFAAACGSSTTTTTAAAPATTATTAATPTTAAPAETTTTAAAPAETTTTAAAATEFTFGMVLVGPYNDRGWSQANYEGGTYVEQKLPGAKMIYVDNAFSRQGTTPEQLADDLLAQGAKMIIFNSDAFESDAINFAKAHPDIPTVFTSGDTSWKDGKKYQDLPNLSCIMGKMEYGKMMAGVAAALTTQTGKIGYLGPIINDETRRLASSVYLGARYAWTEYLKKDPKDLKFTVNWIGGWFNQPGVTSDPTQVADNFFNSGYDVVISGIDTTEALVEAGKMAAAGKKVWAIPYDYAGSMDEAPTVALGVPFFNWGPAYLKAVTLASQGKFTSYWEWNGPDWADINNVDTSAVGFKKGEGLSADAGAKVDEFIKALAGGLNLWKGPLNLQDGTVYLKDGEVATDLQIWYLPQLLEGMEGQSVAK
jgi:simple sugar transport system substrate-binding protein